MPLTTLPSESGNAAPAILDAPVQSEIRSGPSKLAASLEPGFIEAAARVAKEEQNERLGQLKDKFTASANVLSNSLSRSKAAPGAEEADIGDEALPNKKGASPPPVAYLHDVVVDMAGYHSKQESDQTVTGNGEESRYRFEDYLTTTQAARAQEKLM